MNGLQIFQNERFGTVRTITEEGKTLFCGSDVAKALGYKRPNDAITAHCKGTVKRRIGVQTGTKADGSPANQQVEMLFIPEGDIYRLAAKSELPGASEFESWIFDEVLPAIHRTGYYGSQERMLTIIAESMERLTNCMTVITEQISMLSKRMEQLVPTMDPQPMLNPPVTQPSATMDSMDIARLLSWDHRSALRTIRRTIHHAQTDGINIDGCFTVCYRRGKNNVRYSYYQVNERGVGLICKSLRDDSLAENLRDAFHN